MENKNQGLSYCSQINPEQLAIIPSNNKNEEINPKVINEFILGDIIGEGTFGTVCIATHTETREQVAVKILDKIKIYQRDHKTRVEKEIKIMKCLRHNNIAQLYSVIQTKENIYLIIEYVKGKELFEHIINKQKLSDYEACSIYQQIISGLEYLHTLRIAHRDLKPENLLLDQKNTIKIIDLGLSNEFYDDELLSTPCGSPCYAAPEMLNGTLYKAPCCDIWSSGIILYAMLCGYLPFEDIDNDTLYRKIAQGRFTIPSYLSENAQDLIKRVLTTDPIDRLTISQIKRHPWFNLNNPNKTMSPGLLININVIPIDEDIVNEMISYGYQKEEVRSNLLSNRHNNISTIYYLLLHKAIRNKKQSIADLKSTKFLSFIKDKNNLFSNFNNNFNDVIAARAADPTIQLPKANTDKIPIRKKRYMDMTISSSNKDYKSRKQGDSVDSMKSRFTICHFKKNKQCNNNNGGKSQTKNQNKSNKCNERNNSSNSPQQRKLLKRGYFSLHNEDAIIKSSIVKKKKHVFTYSDEKIVNNCNPKIWSKNKNVRATQKNIYMPTNTDIIDERFSKKISLIHYHNSKSQSKHKCKGQYQNKRDTNKKAVILKTNIKHDKSGYFNRYYRTKSKSKSQKGISTKVYIRDEATNHVPYDVVCISPSNHLKLKETLTNALQRCRINFRTPHVSIPYLNDYFKQYKYFCEEDRLQFSIELIKALDVINGYQLQFKRINGTFQLFRSILSNLIENINYD